MFSAELGDVIETLDDQTLATLRTLLMIEYARCHNMPGASVIKYFEGISLTRKEAAAKQNKTAQALKNIKRNS